MMETSRDIKLKISLRDGHEQTVTLREDAPELLTLFSALSNPQAASQFVQLPLEGGRVACSFHTSQLVSIVSEPPVVLKLDAPPPPGLPTAASAVRPTQLQRPRFVVIDDFLSAPEHDELLAYALLSEAEFQKGTVTTYEPHLRQNLVILNFGESVHSRLLQNRLLTWFPLLAKTLGMPLFPLAPLESHLTAATDGYYFKTHSDEAPEIPRVLSCLYYLHREPRGFAGGELRLYDRIDEGEGRRPADTFTAVIPRANRLVVFPSDEFHEAMPVRCPSKTFADSRFAVTTWLHRAPQVDPAATFGWGHLHCGVVAPQFALGEKKGSRA
ncbi:MAG TPA: 2OG-Fe(II) oxygenase [Polyangia bacterium]|jgi:Rps23 Pro-64 3,4-dihydroxylase Tpa1-like proline 4-hydroxylase